MYRNVLFYLKNNDRTMSRKPQGLEDLCLRSIKVYNPVTDSFNFPDNLRYYREPINTDYPLNLAEGYENYIHRDYKMSPLCPTLDYIMNQEKSILRRIEFCTNRMALTEIMKATSGGSTTQWMATKFKDCIYLDAVLCDCKPRHEAQKRRVSFIYKMRQLVFADSPDGKPNTDEAIDENRQMYAVYSAMIGKFRLLYSAQISGVENCELLGDLRNPLIIKNCKPIEVHVFNGTMHQLIQNPRMLKWPAQAYLTGTKKLKVALADKHGVVQEPLQDLDCNIFKKEKKSCEILLYRFLTRISELMLHIDNPYVVFLFKIEEDGAVSYEKCSDRSFLNYQYISTIHNEFSK